MSKNNALKIFYAVALEVCGKEFLSDLTDDDKHAMGKSLYDKGYPYSVSTDIADQTSFGYGELDSNGFFEYPIYERDMVHGRNPERAQKGELLAVTL